MGSSIGLARSGPDTQYSGFFSPYCQRAKLIVRVAYTTIFRTASTRGHVCILTVRVRVSTALVRDHIVLTSFFPL